MQVIATIYEKNKGSQKRRAKIYVTTKGDDMKKLLLLLTTLFTLTMSASEPLRFASVVVDLPTVTATQADVTINIEGGTAPYTYTLGTSSQGPFIRSLCISLKEELGI